MSVAVMVDPAGARREPDTSVARGLAPERLSYGYEIVGGQGLAWRPVRVFDDGQHVYIQMHPRCRRARRLRSSVQSRGGDSALVNYRVRLPYYVIGGTLVVLVLAGLVALRAQGSRTTRRSARRSRSGPSSCRCSSGSSRRTASSRRGGAGLRTGLDRDR